MTSLNSLLVSSIMAAGFAVSINVNASEPSGVSCSVSVDYLKNGALAESYQKAFTVTPGAGFTDDFSTLTRQKFFTASTLLDAGKTVVGISYFNDVGVFDAEEFSTKLTLHKAGVLESTSGSHTFSTSSFPQAGGVAVNVSHEINYSLTCKQLKK
jgi:hypothetical protein